jgi:hypothetical protein
MSFFKKRPKAAIRIEREAFNAARPTLHIVDTIDEIEELIRHMEDNPQFFINKHAEENQAFDPKRISFKVQRIQKDEMYEGVPLLASAKYTYHHKEPLSAHIPWRLVGIILGLAFVAFIAWFMSLSVQKAETDFFQPACTLFIEDGKPVGIQIYGENLHYGSDGKITDFIWEGTANGEMLQMAYDPINAGCAVAHLD